MAIGFLKLLPANNNGNMSTIKKQEKNLLTQDVKMDACANFTMNGDTVSEIDFYVPV